MTVSSALQEDFSLIIKDTFTGKSQDDLLVTDLASYPSLLALYMEALCLSMPG